MKKFIKSSLLIVALLVATLLPSSFVSAQAANQSARCTKGQAHLATILTKIDTLQTARTTAYDGIATKLDKIIASAKIATYDTAALTAAKDALVVKTTAYKDGSVAYAKNLTATKNLSCGDSDAAYATSLTTSRASLVTLRGNSLGVRTTYTEKVVPALKDYITWLKENATTDGETN